MCFCHQAVQLYNFDTGRMAVMSCSQEGNHKSPSSQGRSQEFHLGGYKF